MIKKGPKKEGKLAKNDHKWSKKFKNGQKSKKD